MRDMLKKAVPWILFLFGAMAFSGCHPAPEKKVIQFEILDSGLVNDSLSAHRANYTEDFNLWKTVYEQCMHDTLFHNAFYLGLQDNLGLGGISNQKVLNANKQISVLDTSGNNNIFNLLAVNNSANCFTKINLNKNLQDTFYNELIRVLKYAGDYKYLADLVDTNQINFQISTLIDFSFRPDSVVSILQRTKDSSLLYFRQILTTPGNVLLIRTAMIFGFHTRFHLKRKLSLEEEGKIKKEVFFKGGDYGANGSIQMLPDLFVQVIINKNYTIFGQFYVFK
jgi:hypothetical protein